MKVMSKQMVKEFASSNKKIAIMKCLRKVGKEISMHHNRSMK